MTGFSSDIWKVEICSSSLCTSKQSETVSVRSTIPKDWDEHFEVEISKEKVGSDTKGLVCCCSDCKHNPCIKDNTAFQSVCVSVWVCACVHKRLDSLVCTFVCAHVCLSFYRPRAFGPFLLIVLWVPHWGGRRGRLTMFPVGEPLMLSPGGNAVHSHFPFICCVSFNVYNYLKSHQALCAV